MRFVITTRPSRRRRALFTVAAWVVAVAALTALGSGVSGRLSPMSLEVPGTPAARAEATLRAKFGNTIPIAILLRGPAAQLSGQGRRLAAALRAHHGVEVLSPWDEAAPATTAAGGSIAAPGSQAAAGQALRTTLTALQPRPDAAFLLVDYMRPPSAALAVAPEAEAVVKSVVRQPVHAYLTGIAVIGRAIQNETLKDTAQAEIIALPVLIIVLLIVFRSPVAAAVPLLMGGAAVGAGRGLLSLVSMLTPINSLSVAIAAMMSLALGVDYALLFVSRVRQELRAGRHHATAVIIARRRAGRTIAAAGGTLALTMLAASLVATPGLLGPVAIGVVISGLLSVALALSAMPALLLLVGHSLNRWEIKLSRSTEGERRGRARALADALISRPAITAPIILLSMLALAEPALALRMGPPDASELPPSNPARVAVEKFEETIGAGWTAPFVVVASAKEGPITTQARLNALIHWQHQVASLPDVASVLGPGSVAGATATLAHAHAVLMSTPKRLSGAQQGVARLRGGLARAEGGVQRLREGLLTAAAGAGSLASGDRAAQRGAQSLATGAGRAYEGSKRLAAQSGRAHAGAKRLATQSGRAQAGAQQLAAGAGRARRGAKKLAAESGRAQAGASRLATETGRADEGASALQNGLTQASAGSSRLASGLEEASAGAERLAAGDAQLRAGATQLATGIDALDETVNAALAPIQVLAVHLREWALWLESVQLSGQQLKAGLSAATQALRSLPVSHQDPAYETLSGDISTLSEEIERDGISQLDHIEQLLSAGLKAISELPAQISRLTESLNSLRTGADRLAQGTAESEEGAKALSAALHRLVTGGRELSNGLSALSGDAGSLAGGLSQLKGGGEQLAGGLDRLHAGDEQLAGGLRDLSGGGRRLAGGLHRLKGGNERLANGLQRLQGGNEQLAAGVQKLEGGAGGLAGGLSRLGSGGEQLAGGLTHAGAQSGALVNGLDAAAHPLRTYEAMLSAYQRDYEALHTSSPGALDSGYLVLAALDGTVSPMREQVAQMVNVDAGGQAMRIIVVAGSPPTSAATAKLSRRLTEKLPALAAATGARVQVGQGAAYLLNYTDANDARFPWLIFALAIVATLTLIVVLRALLLPLIAVLLNLATIFVALGVLVLLTKAHMLGGASFIDAASGAGIISIMFVLSIDYEVFLLTRMREHWTQNHDANGAIAHGLRHTASVITGSAAIMTAVFLAFSGAAVVPLRQFGVGLTIAVLLDAAIVRLVLLPSVMRLLGPAVWWMPSWLQRLLPAVE